MSIHEETTTRVPALRAPTAVERRRAVAVLVLLVVFGLAAWVTAPRRPGNAAGGARVSAVGADVAVLPPPFRFPPPPSAREARALHRLMGVTPFVSAGGRRHRLVALTFDDGPGPYTHRIAAELRRLRVPATFFQVGQMMTEFPAAARDVRRSFPVGDHTLSHPLLGRLPAGAQRHQIVAQAARMRALGGSAPLMFRPPYASFDRATLGLLRRMGMLMVLWSVDSEDYTLPGTRQVVRNVVSRVRPGAIVLMHDAGGPRTQTAAALPAIVHRLRRRGYHFVTVPRMMAEAPPKHRQKLPPGAR